MKKYVLVCDMCPANDAKEALPRDSVKLRLNDYGSALDVCPDHSQEVRRTILAIMKHGSGGAKNAPKASGAKTAIDPEQNRVMREWLKANGVKFNERGKLAQRHIDMYQEAHPG